MPEQQGEAGLATELAETYNQLRAAAQEFHDILNSANSSPSDIGRGFGDWAVAVSRAVGQIGEGYQEDFEYLGDRMAGGGVAGELAEGGMAIAGAAVEGATQVTMTAESMALGVASELIGAAAESGGLLDEAYSALENGDATTAMHNLISIGWVIADSAGDVVGQSIAGSLHVGLEALAGVFDIVYESGEMGAEVTAAAVQQWQEAYSDGDVPLFDNVGAVSGGYISDDPNVSQDSARNEFNMEQDATRNEFNMEQDATRNEFNMEQDTEDGYNPEWGEGY